MPRQHSRAGCGGRDVDGLPKVMHAGEITLPVIYYGGREQKYKGYAATPLAIPSPALAVRKAVH